MGVKLRDYQVPAQQFLLHRKRAILGDVRGVGKTFPAIAAATHNEGYILVVCPSYLIPQWEEYILEWDPHADIVRFTGEPDQRKKKLTEFKKLRSGWLLMGYSMLQEKPKPREQLNLYKHPDLYYIRWTTIIFDECHHLRTRSAYQSQNAVKLTADNIYMLSGTPIVSNPGDMFQQLKILYPKQFKSYWQFVEHFCVLDRTPWAVEVRGLRKGMMDEWAELMDQHMLRRGREVLDLKDPVHTVIPVDLPAKVMETYRKAKKDWLIEHPKLDDPIAISSGGALIAKLRQIVAGYVADELGEIQDIGSSLKMKTTIDMVSDIPERVVVFTWFRESANRIAAGLKDKRRNVWIITGDVPPLKRNAILQAWKEDPQGIIVATLASLQEGANLQTGSVVVFFEEDFLPKTMDQALGRLDRSGQKEAVTVYHIVARRTVDESVIRVQKARDAHNSVAMMLRNIFAED
jgi:SNF2 family DNA or RNA helicase